MTKTPDTPVDWDHETPDPETSVTRELCEVSDDDRPLDVHGEPGEES
jgi:hypothetical protein